MTIATKARCRVILSFIPNCLAGQEAKVSGLKVPQHPRETAACLVADLVVDPEFVKGTRLVHSCAVEIEVLETKHQGGTQTLCRLASRFMAACRCRLSDNLLTITHLYISHYEPSWTASVNTLPSELSMALHPSLFSTERPCHSPYQCLVGWSQSPIPASAAGIQPVTAKAEGISSMIPCYIDHVR